MQPRLLIAYCLVALLLLFAAAGVTWLACNTRARRRRRWLAREQAGTVRTPPPI